MKARPALVWIILAGCGGSTDYLGQPPDEAAAQLADVGCDLMFECGLYDITCDPPEVTRHDASEYYDSHAACVADLASFYVELFEGCAAANLTEAEKDSLNECLNANRSSCPSQTDIDNAIDQVC